MLGIGAVDDVAPAALEAVTVGIARVALQLGHHLEPGDIHRLPWHQPHELDRGAELVERYREAGRRLLQAERLLEDVMRAVDADARAAHVRRAEEGEAERVDCQPDRGVCRQVLVDEAEQRPERRVVVRLNLPARHLPHGRGRAESDRLLDIVGQ